MGQAFIRAYGLHWLRNEVEWARNGEMLGRRNERVDALHLANFWKQTGIYVLHDPHGAYYVGQVERQPLGERLRQHTGDNHNGNWDRFSWFGFNSVLRGRTGDGLYRVKTARPKDLLGSTDRTIHDIEALLIVTLGTYRAGNKRTEKFTGAQMWEQVGAHERERFREVAGRQAREHIGPMFT